MLTIICHNSGAGLASSSVGCVGCWIECAVFIFYWVIIISTKNRARLCYITISFLYQMKYYIINMVRAKL